MSDSPEVTIILDKTWRQTDLPSRINAEIHQDQFVANVKKEDVQILVNEFLLKKDLGGMIFRHIPPYKPAEGTKICDKCNGSGTIPAAAQDEFRF